MVRMSIICVCVCVCMFCVCVYVSVCYFLTYIYIIIYILYSHIQLNSIIYFICINFVYICSAAPASAYMRGAFAKSAPVPVHVIM